MLATFKKVFIVILRFLSLVLVSLLPFALSSHAEDVVKWESGKNPNDPRSVYKLNIIDTALKKTEPRFGPYRIETIALKSRVNNTRAQEMLRAGDVINTYVALASKEWESAALPVRIPIRRGIVAYRLLLVNRDQLSTFAKVKTFEDLRRLKVGLQVGWTTTKVMEADGFNIVSGTKFDSLFHMLDGNRFDYLPQGINEVFANLNKHTPALNLAVEPRLALRIPAPTYIFISKKNQRLAERLEAGLEIMVADGTLQKMFRDQFAKAIEKAELSNRLIIDVPNKLLPEATPLDRKELWFDVNETY